MPQLLAALLFMLTYLPARLLLKRIPKYRVKWWHVAVSLMALFALLLLSLNIVLGLIPGEPFLEARMTERRLQLTLAFYLGFAINLAIVVALLNRLKPGG